MTIKDIKEDRKEKEKRTRREGRRDILFFRYFLNPNGFDNLEFVVITWVTYDTNECFCRFSSIMTGVPVIYDQSCQSLK